MTAWVTLVLPTEPVTAPRRACGRAVAGRDAQALQRLQGVVDHAPPSRTTGCEASAPAAPLARACGDELVAVAHAGQGHEQVAGLERAGVDGDAGRGERPAGQPAAGGGGDLVGGPERLSHGPAPGRRAVSATSSKGWIDVADDLALLVALAGHHQDVAVAQHGRGGADRLAAVADLAARPARAGQHLGADRGGVLASADCRR